MSDVPRTVRTALSDVPVAGTTALEAGAGAGNGTAGLLAAGADAVYAVTDEGGHAATVRDRCPAADVVIADLRSIPLPTDSVDVVFAHGLFNVLPNEAAVDVASELTRVAAPGAWLVIDDYDPHPPDSRIRRLFGVENALAELTTGRPAYVFYPAAALRRLFEGHDWRHDRTTTLLDPVPWSSDHMEAHVEAARELATAVDGEVAESLVARAVALASEGEERTGRMYSLALRYAQ